MLAVRAFGLYDSDGLRITRRRYGTVAFKVSLNAADALRVRRSSAGMGHGSTARSASVVNAGQGVLRYSTRSVPFGASARRYGALNF